MAEGNCPRRKVWMVRDENMVFWKGWTFIPVPLAPLFSSSIFHKSVQPDFVLLTLGDRAVEWSALSCLRVWSAIQWQGPMPRPRRKPSLEEDEKGSAGSHNHLPARSGKKKQSQVWRCPVSQSTGRADATYRNTLDPYKAIPDADRDQQSHLKAKTKQNKKTVSILDREIRWREFQNEVFGCKRQCLHFLQIVTHASAKPITQWDGLLRVKLPGNGARQSIFRHRYSLWYLWDYQNLTGHSLGQPAVADPAWEGELE